MPSDRFEDLLDAIEASDDRLAEALRGALLSEATQGDASDLLAEHYPRLFVWMDEWIDLRESARLADLGRDGARPAYAPSAEAGCSSASSFCMK